VFDEGFVRLWYSERPVVVEDCWS